MALVDEMQRLVDEPHRRAVELRAIRWAEQIGSRSIGASFHAPGAMISQRRNGCGCDLLGFALGLNALSWHRHRQRQTLAAVA